MSKAPNKRLLGRVLKTLSLICFVLASISLILGLLFLMNMERLQTAPGNWMHFGIPAGLFIASWLLQLLGRKYT